MAHALSMSGIKCVKITKTLAWSPSGIWESGCLRPEGINEGYTSARPLSRAGHYDRPATKATRPPSHLDHGDESTMATTTARPL